MNNICFFTSFEYCDLFSFVLWFLYFIIKNVRCWPKEVLVLNFATSSKPFTAFSRLIWFVSINAFVNLVTLVLVKLIFSFFKEVSIMCSSLGSILSSVISSVSATTALASSSSTAVWWLVVIWMLSSCLWSLSTFASTSLTSASSTSSTWKWDYIRIEVKLFCLSRHLNFVWSLLGFWLDLVGISSWFIIITKKWFKISFFSSVTSTSLTLTNLTFIVMVISVPSVVFSSTSVRLWIRWRSFWLRIFNFGVFLRHLVDSLNFSWSLSLLINLVRINLSKPLHLLLFWLFFFVFVSSVVLLTFFSFLAYLTFGRIVRRITSSSKFTVRLDLHFKFD